MGLWSEGGWDWSHQEARLGCSNGHFPLSLSVLSQGLSSPCSLCSRVAELLTWSLRAPKSQISRREAAKAVGHLRARPRATQCHFHHTLLGRAALSQTRVSVGGDCPGCDMEGHQKQATTELPLLGLNLDSTY